MNPSISGKIRWFRRWLCVYCCLAGLCLLGTVAGAQTIQQAVERGDLARVRRMLAAEPGLVNYIGDFGNTPLHTAVDNGRLAVARALIAAGANVNSAGSRGDGWTPLFNAVDRRQSELARLLLANGAQVDYRDKKDNTPLAYAADSRADLAEILLSAGADVNARRSSDGWTPLFTAVHHDALDAIRVLLSHRANMLARSTDGNTPMHIAANFGYPDAIALLLDGGQNVDTPNADGNTPLMVAAWYGRIDAGHFLIGAGADINAHNKEGRTAIDEALRNHQDAFADMIRTYQLALDARAASDRDTAAIRNLIRPGYLNWAMAAPRTMRVYNNDFTSERVGPEWTTLPERGAEQGALKVSMTPEGGHHFLGELGSQTARLTLTDLPAHREASFSFDLYILRTWDGNNLNFGPDLWSLSLHNGPTLLHTTFANTTGVRGANARIQAYPGSYPGDHNPCDCGAAEVNTLGYEADLGGPIPMDAVYHLGYTLPHTGSTLSLDFTATGLEALNNESWGLTNVQVSLASPAPVAAPTVARSAAVAPRAVSPGRRTVPIAHRTRATPSRPGKKPTGKKSPKPSSPVIRLHPREKPPGV
jgi:ankyrin repeat protein